MKITENQRKWLVSIAANLLLLMTALDITIVNLALPTIAHALNAKMATLEWVINAYIVTFVMLLVLGGKLGDIFGHRRVLSIGLAIFIIASLMGGFANNALTLILSRVLQGIGAALAFPSSCIINFTIFPKHQKSIGMGITATVAGAGQALGPSIGGIILKFTSWSWVFFVNVPVGILTITLLLLICPKYVLPLQRQKINYLATLLIALGVFSLVFGLIESQSWHLISVNFAVCCGASMAFFWLFYLNSKRTLNPLFDLAVFQNKIFIMATVARIAMAFCIFVIMFSVVLYMQNIAGIPPLNAGYLLLCMTAVWASSSPIIGIIASYIKNGASKILFIGIILLATAFVLFSQLSSTPSTAYLALAFLLAGLGIPMMFTASNTLALTSVPQHQVSSANSLIYLIALFFNMIGVAASGTALSVLSSAFLLKQLQMNSIQLTKVSLVALMRVSNGSFPFAKLGTLLNLNSNVTAKLAPMAMQSFLHAFTTIMWFCFALLAMAFIICLKIKVASCENSKLTNRF